MQSRHIKKIANLALYSIIEFAYANFIPTTFNCNEHTKTKTGHRMEMLKEDLEVSK